MRNVGIVVGFMMNNRFVLLKVKDVIFLIDGMVLWLCVDLFLMLMKKLYNQIKGVGLKVIMILYRQYRLDIFVYNFCKIINQEFRYLNIQFLGGFLLFLNCILVYGLIYYLESFLWVLGGLNQLLKELYDYFKFCLEIFGE